MTESTDSARAETGTRSTADALKIRAPSRCNFNPCSFAMAETEPM